MKSQIDSVFSPIADVSYIKYLIWLIKCEITDISDSRYLSWDISWKSQMTDISDCRYLRLQISQIADISDGIVENVWLEPMVLVESSQCCW